MGKGVILSTISKLNTEVRRNRAARRNLLRNHRPRTYEDAVVLAELALIAASSRLTGDMKQRLFTRGAWQMAK
jgi:hypothetical protein